MATDISLGSATRSNLLSLQRTTSKVSATQERLSTGKKVNSALDNALAYFTSSTLTNRANDLVNIKETIEQTIQTVTVATQTLGAVENVLDQMKGLAVAAKTTTDTTERGNYAAQFDVLRDQLDNIVNDGSYKGTNLLKNPADDVTVTFDENSKHQVTINGSASDVATLGISKAEASGGTTTYLPSAGYEVTDPGTIAVLDGLQDGSPDFGREKPTGTQVYWGFSAADNQHASDWWNGMAAPGYVPPLDSNAILNDLVSYIVVDPTTDVSGLLPPSEYTASTTGGGWGDADTAAGNTAIDASIAEIDAALSTVRSTSKTLSTDVSAMKIRSEFTATLTDNLSLGSDKLVNADMNEESANLLALQNRTQLATISLSLAQQSEQSILAMF